MKATATIVLGLAGLIYGLLAVNLVSQDSPETLRWFIVAGVAAVGAMVGRLTGFAVSLFPRKKADDKTKARMHRVV